MTKVKPKNTYGYTPEQYSKFKNFAWKMLLSFGITYLFFYNGRQNINLVMKQMAAELGSTEAALGIVSGALFWCYAFGQLINGRLGAYFGYKKFMMFGVLASAALNAIISFQHSIPVIAVLWGLNGYFQSMVWANGLGVLNKWWPKDKRGFASGLTTAFSGAAQVVTYLTIYLCLDMNPEWGWRAAFRYPMIPMVLILIGFWLFFHTCPEDVGLPAFKEESNDDSAPSAELEGKGYFYPYKVLLTQPKVILLCFIAAIAGVGRYGLLTWIPTYFSDSLNLSIKSSIFSSILLPIGHACAMFLFPFLTDKVFKGKREPILIIASIVTVCGMITFPFIRTQALASTMLFVVGVSGMVTGVIWAIAGDIGGRAYSSALVGILDWAVYMGAAVQAFAFGFVKDNFGWTAVFITIGSLYIIMLILVIIVKSLKDKSIK